MPGERNNIDRAAASERPGSAACSQNIIGGQGETLEPGVHTLVVPDSNVDLAAFQQRHLVHPQSLGQLHAHIREIFGESRKEIQKDALNGLWWRSHLKHT